jgi:hypothetical protein
MSIVWWIGDLFTMAYLNTGFWKSIGCLFSGLYYWANTLGVKRNE